MNDDYLWDRSGEPDPEVERLEELLSRYRHEGDGSDLALEASLVVPFHRRRWVVLAIAAILVLVVGGALLQGRLTTWEILSIDGSTTVANQTVDAGSEISRGDVVATGEDGSARIRIGAIGFVDVAPRSRLRLLRSRTTRQHLELEHGRIDAVITAPPRIFLVSTPVVEAIDLGCAYTLDIDPEGYGYLEVSLGWVALENGREAYVPAGARSLLDPTMGPGTPVFDDASPELREAVRQLDFETLSGEERRVALFVVLRNAKERDLITLWHLLLRTNDEERILVVKGITMLIELPAGVDRKDLARGDEDAITRLGAELGIRESTWWSGFIDEVARRLG